MAVSARSLIMHFRHPQGLACAARGGTILRMSADKSTDALSIIRDSPHVFDTAMRGYDRRQVDEMIMNLDDELRAASVERETFTARVEDLSSQLESAFAQIDSLRRQLRA